MLNAYPDSMGGTLGDIVDLLKKEEFWTHKVWEIRRKAVQMKKHLYRFWC